MSLTRGSDHAGLWCDFQSLLADFSGISVQAFDERGGAVQPSPALPELCAYLQRFPDTSAACRKDCFRKAVTCRDFRRILSARCYAGLNYRVLPIRKGRRPYGVILVGRVLSEVFGGEQCLGFIEKYRLSQPSFLRSLSGMRAISSADLDRAAAFVRHLAVSLVATGSKLGNRNAQLQRRRGLLDLARHAMAFDDRAPEQGRRLLESLIRLLGASGSALILAGEEDARPEVQASVGLGEAVLHELSRQDWRRLTQVHGRGPRLFLPDRQAQLRIGLDLADTALAVQELVHGAHAPGWLLVCGKTLGARDLDLLEQAAGFFAARIVQQRYREIAERKEEEARLLGLMAERCLTARSVEELLPLALEAAMHCLHARRGSILLAEERGRITARALRGDHAQISESIEALHPGSVSHEVFFKRHPLLVQDVDREPGLKRERQFPYATRSFVSVPLRDNGHALGVLHLTEREGAEVFTPSDLSLLERLSRQASGAICKARLEQEVESLRVASTTDHLTGVYNRRFLEQRLEIEFQRASRFHQPLAVAMLDLDDFKSLNDEMGHACGDSVLREIAGVVRRQLRSVDLVARYGGDEFVLLLPGTGAAGAMSTIDKIRRRVGEAVVPGVDPQRKFSVSAGFSVFPDTGAVAGDLLQRADEALFQAKKAGRNAAMLWASH